MKRHFRYFCIVLFTILSICLISNVSATWNIHRQIDNGYKFVDSSTQGYYDVTVKHITRSLSEPTITENSLKGTETAYSSTTEADYNRGKGEHLLATRPGTTTTTSEINSEGKLIVTTTTITYKDMLLLESVNRKYNIWPPGYTYTNSGKKYTITVTTISVQTQEINYLQETIYKVKKNEMFKKPKISISNYTFIGYSNATADGSTTNNVSFDFSTPITKNITIIGEWVLNNASQNQALTTYVNSLSGSGNIFIGSNASFNITNDSSFNSNLNRVSLGNETLQTTIQSNATVNFCMNDGETDIEARLEESISDSLKHTTGAATSGYISNDQYISLDFYESLTQKNPNDYTIVLQNDLIVNGNLYIGGYTGSSYQYSGYIIKNYVSFDLNGHSLIINDGGMVHSFGLITDSVGTGKIEVMPGGNLKTPFVLYDLKGGNTTLWGYSKGICPFENYQIPYLECKINFHVSSTKSGSLDIFTKLNLGSLGVTNIYIPFIGFGSNYLVSCQSSNTSAIVHYEPYDLACLQTKTDTIKQNMSYRKISFTFKDLTATVNSISTKAAVDLKGIISKTFDLQLDRVIFPISTLIDIHFINSTFNVSQLIKLMPGSTLTMDEQSILNLNYYKDSSNNTRKKFDDIKVSTKTLPGETKALSGGIVALSLPPSAKTGTNYQNVPSMFYGIFGGSYSLYWQYFQEATVNIYGTVNFNSGNDAPYELSGFMNINQFTINGNNPQKFNATNISSLNSNVKLQTYSFDLEIVTCVWFEGTSGMLSPNNNSSISSANHFYIQPLVSKDVAYYKEATSSNVITGKFDQYSGIFTKDSGTQAFFYTDNNLLVGSSTESAFNQTASLKDCTYDESFHGITSEGIRYIYYAGIWCPIVEDATIPAKAEIVVNTSKLVHNKEKYTDTSYSYATTPFAYNTTYKAWRVTY